MHRKFILGGELFLLRGFCVVRNTGETEAQSMSNLMPVLLIAELTCCACAENLSLIATWRSVYGLAVMAA